MKAILRVHEQYSFQDRYVIELSLYEVADLKQYPQGIKYGLICVDTKTGDRVLMDNHFPKGHHIHINNKELNYDFTSYNKLLKDFRLLVFKEMGVKI